MRNGGGKRERKGRWRRERARIGISSEDGKERGK